MHLSKLVSTLFIIAGILLMVFGLAAMDSFGSDVSRFFTGAPTDKSVWMLIGGLAAVAVGSSGIFRARSKA